VRRVDRYPWDALAPVRRGAARNARRVRAAISPLASFDRFAEAASEILSAEVRIDVIRRVAPWAARPEASVFLETGDGSTSLAVELEPALATLVLARVLGRPTVLTNPRAALDDAARGALSAVLVEVARRALPGVPLRARDECASDPTTDIVVISTAVFVDTRPYHATISAFAREVPSISPEDEPPLDALGSLPLELPMVAARSVTTRDELATLRPGDVWLPGTGWLGDVASAGGDGRTSRRILERGALSPPGSEYGVEVGCSEDGRLVLRGNVIALGADVTDAEARGRSEPAMSDETLTDLVLEAPVVVRVEVGSVTLSAREWAALRPGDVLETGIPLAQPAVLRVAGREVARGELVSVEGELGVRIREITRAEPPE